MDNPSVSVDVKWTNVAQIGAKLTGWSNSYRLSTLWEKEIYIRTSNIISLSRMKMYILDKEIIFDVPTKLHLVWIGKEIPQKYIDNILSFEKYNGQYDVI